MEKSYNGWTASPKFADFGGLDNRVVAGVTMSPGVRRGDVATVLFYVAEQFHHRVEKLATPGCWGFAYRQNRNANNLSCHASATAIDLNAPRHPNGKRGTFSKAQVAEIRRILAEVGGAVRWGGDFTGTPDEMHFEIVASPATVAMIAARLTGSGSTSSPATTLPAAPAKTGGLFMSLTDAEERRILKFVDDWGYLLPTVKGNTDLVPAMATAVGEIRWGVLDPEQGLRVALSGLFARVSQGSGTGITPADIAAMIPTDLARKVADELHNRLAA